MMLNTVGLIIAELKVNGSFLVFYLIKNILWNHQIFIILGMEVMLVDVNGNVLISIYHC